MERQEVTAIRQRIEALLGVGAAADPVLKNYTIAPAGGSFDTDFVMKLRITPKVIKAVGTDLLGGAVTDQSLQDGLAKGGTPVTYQSKRGLCKATIIKARSTRYLVRDDQDGKEYTIPFRAVKVDRERLPAV